MYIPFLPFLGKTSEAKRNKMLKNFVKYIDKNDPSSTASPSRRSPTGLFFAEAVDDGDQGRRQRAHPRGPARRGREASTTSTPTG